MGAEIFDVEINLDGVIIAYATKLTTKKNKQTSTTLTFDGEITTSAKKTGGTISLESLVWPGSVDEAIALEDKLEDNNIKTITCTGTSYTSAGEPYTRKVIGTGVTVTSDEDEWSPSDGVTQKLEFAVNELVRKAE